ncbi:MAG: hypothetical protein R3B07_11585 [Polyangiaceae bacterium]
MNWRWHASGVERRLAQGDIAGVVLEVVQGAGGGNEWTDDDLRARRSL